MDEKNELANSGEFTAIYAAFQPKIYRYLARLVGKQEAEDLTQEVFVKVGKALSTFHNESQLSTWIYRIATNTAIDRMRNPAFQQETAWDPEERALVQSRGKMQVYCKKKNSLEDQVIHEEMNACIRGVIQHLPENYRTVVILSELEGLKNKEIAEILEVSLDVVKARLHRGKTRLKKELLQHCNFSWDERNEFTCDPKHPRKK